MVKTFPAKFASWCPSCNNKIEIGTPVNWTPGSEKQVSLAIPIYQALVRANQPEDYDLPDLSF